MKSFIFNARLVDEQTDTRGSVILNNGKIEKIFFCDGTDSELVKSLHTDIASCGLHINAKGKVVMPSFIDMHAHFRYPGQSEKEDLNSGLKAAAAGGYTTVVLMPNTNPTVSSREEAMSVIAEANKIGTAKVFQTVSLTKRFNGKDVSHLSYLDKKDIPIVTEDGKDVEHDDVMKEAMSLCAQKGILVACHCEKNSLVPLAKIERDNKNFTKAEKLLADAENEYTKRNLAIALETGCSIHIQHCSTQKSLEYVIEARAKESFPGQISCEVTPHHACLSYEMNGYESELVNPPLRSEKDRLFLVKALSDGNAGIIGTDHAPHTAADKENGACGFSGIETAFSLCYTELVLKKYFDLSRLSSLMSAGPARRLSLNKGLLKEGMDADLVLIDLDQTFIVNTDNFFSKGKYTPIKGKMMFGRICTTFYEGKVVYET